MSWGGKMGIGCESIEWVGKGEWGGVLGMEIGREEWKRRRLILGLEGVVSGRSWVGMVVWLDG